MERELVERCTVLRATVGSEMFGLNLQDGSSDRDEMGICVEPMEHVVGFNPFEQFVLEATKGEGLDLTVYSLRKYLRLALKGNPTILTLLYVPADKCLVREPVGKKLQEMAPYFITKRAGRAFLGYLTAQRQRLLGERGQKDVNRPELVAKYGFDTKYAMHMLRLGYQGIELMQSGKLTLPMKEPERSFLYGVRVGQSSLQECLTRCGELERELEDLLDNPYLPDVPDVATVENWMLGVYQKEWE